MSARNRMARAVAVAAVALAMPAAASAAVHIQSLDVSAYPRAQATVVASKPSRVAPVLSENGKPAAGSVATNLGQDKSIVLLIDNSRSMKGKSFKSAIAAAQAFVNDKSFNDLTSVVSFGSNDVELTELSATAAVAREALNGLHIDTKEGTALFDAIVTATKQFGSESGGRVILLVTDGTDTGSDASFPDAVKAARRAGALVYAVGITGTQFSPGKLRSLTSKTGGNYRTATAANLSDVYHQIAAELKRTWRIDYITGARPGETRKVTAYVPGQGRARATLTIPESAALAGPSGLLPEFAYGRGGIAGLAVLVGMLVLLGYSLVSSSTSADRLRMRVQQHVVIKPKRAKKEKKERLQALSGLFAVTERALGHTRFWRYLYALLERADLPLKTVELFYLMVGGGVSFGFVFSILGVSTILNVAALTVGALLPFGFVWMKARRRVAKFEEQLPDILISIAASLKAGHSFKQGLQAIVDEGVEPASKEFKLVLTETRLGRPLEAALGDMAERIGSANLSFIVTAVSVQTQVGGSLAGLFDMVGDTVRNRQQFARKIKALTAMGRMSAYVLIGLPFFLAGALTLMNPSYMAPLYSTSSGHMLIFVSIGMMIIGSLFLKKIVSFKG
jgi:tight adherence protein B